MPKTGQYRINYYNKYGSLLKGRKHTGENLHETKEKAELFLAKRAKKYKKHGGDVSLVPVSYTVDRRVFNSLDKTESF